MTTDEQPNIAAQEARPHRKHSGSENRRRGRTITFRVTKEEYAAIEAAAGSDRVAVGGYVRSRALAMPTTQARRRAPGDILALARLQGELNRIGGTLHQLLRHVNMGRLSDPFHEIRDAFQGYQEAIAAVMAATTRAYCERLPEPAPGPEDDEKEAA